MPRVFWEKHPRIERRMLELDYQGIAHTDVAKTLSDEYPNIGILFTEDMIRNRLKRAKRVQLKDFPQTVLMPYFEKYRNVIEGNTPIPQKIVVPDMSSGRAKILHISDAHIPFQDDSALEFAVQTNLAANVVVEGGDINDCYALSRFEKEVNVPFEQEIEGILRHNEWLSTAFPDVPIIQLSGNHHKRIRRSVEYPQSLNFLYDRDFYTTMASPFPNILAVNNWYYQINDAIFAHDEQASSVDGKSVVNLYQYLQESWEFLGLRPFRVIVQAHTHQVAVTYRYGRKLMESGAMCRAMPYSYSSSRYKKPQACGYVTVIQRDGVSVLNECREHYCPVRAA